MDHIAKIANYMITKVIKLDPDMDVYEAINMLLEFKISGAPVVKDDQLVGVLSEKDCLRILANGSFHDLPGGHVKDYMSIVVRTVNPETDIFAAADIFLQHNFRRLPVVKDNKLVGIISRHDILRAIQNESKKNPPADKDYGYITKQMKDSLSD